jgi:hypothetical protein
VGSLSCDYASFAIAATRSRADSGSPGPAAGRTRHHRYRQLSLVGGIG